MSQRGIPVLMYHKVGAPVHTKADRSLNAEAAVFARQMQALKRMGFEAVTFDEVAAATTGRRAMPGKAVCVTFDDGYRCVAEHAAPALDALGWRATVFVPSGLVGRSNEWDVVTGKPVLPIMDWAELADLQGRGWEMAGHTRTHPHLNQLSDAAALEEIAGGRSEMAEHLGAEPKTFCYPFGSHNAVTATLVRQAGFLGACTTESGLASSGKDAMLLPRVKIAYSDGLLGLCYRIFLRPLLG